MQRMLSSAAVQAHFAEVVIHAKVLDKRYMQGQVCTKWWRSPPKLGYEMQTNYYIFDLKMYSIRAVFQL